MWLTWLKPTWMANGEGFLRAICQIGIILSKAKRGRPKADQAKRLYFFSYFFMKVGGFIGKILGLRQTKKGVKIVAMAWR